MMINRNSARMVGAFLLLSGLAGGDAFAIVVDSVGSLDPNPNNLNSGIILDAASNSGTHGVSLKAFQTLMSSAYPNNTGGVLDFQEQFQGGTWPSQTSANNGVNAGAGPSNKITVTYGNSQLNSFTFYRSDTNGATVEAIDANTNQGTNVISGGGQTRNGTGTALYDFTTNTFGSGSSVGGGYMGIVGDANPVLTFDGGLTAFGISAVPRGSSRRTQITLTLSDNSTIVSSSDTVSTAPLFWGLELTPAEIASGLTISKVTLANPDGVNRFDDLAFITAVPEASALTLCGVTVLGVIGSRRVKRFLGRSNDQSC